MDGRMSATEGASVVEKPFTLLLLLFPGQDHTHRRLYDDVGEQVPVNCVDTILVLLLVI